MRSDLKHLVLALFTLTLTVSVFKPLMIALDARPGFLFPDPLLAIWGPFPLHLPIFLITYVPIVLGILVMLRHPGRREALIYAYCLLQIFRLSTIALVPLAAPLDMIVLNDPIADHLVFGQVVTKDLFFSGHVSALVLFSLYWPTSRGRSAYRWLALLDALLLTGQHVHYSIDVLAAPLFAWLAFRLQIFTSSISKP